MDVNVKNIVKLIQNAQKESLVRTAIGGLRISSLTHHYLRFGMGEVIFNDDRILGMMKQLTSLDISISTYRESPIGLLPLSHGWAFILRDLVMLETLRPTRIEALHITAFTRDYSVFIEELFELDRKDQNWPHILCRLPKLKSLTLRNWDVLGWERSNGYLASLVQVHGDTLKELNLESCHMRSYFATSGEYHTGWAKVGRSCLVNASKLNFVDLTTETLDSEGMIYHVDEDRLQALKFVALKNAGLVPQNLLDMGEAYIGSGFSTWPRMNKMLPLSFLR